MHRRRIGNMEIAGWGHAAGRLILRVGYSDRIIAQLIPDILRIIVETKQLGLKTSAALYLLGSGRQKAMLAGYYNVQWSQLETYVEISPSIQVGPDPQLPIRRILVPIAGATDDPIGALAVYVGNEEEGDYAHLDVLNALVGDISTVILAKQEQELRTAVSPAPDGRPLQAAEGDGHVLHENIFHLLRMTVDNFPGGVCALDEDLTVAMTNKRFYEILDLPAERFPVGCSFKDILRFNAARGEYGPGDIEELAQDRIRHVKLFLEHSFDRDTATGLVLEVRSAPSPGGGCVITYVDVTARKTAERELLHHRDRLEDIVRARTAEIELQAQKLERLLNHERHVNEQQRQFVAMASHEFRTPLAIIDGAAQRLTRRKREITDEFIGEKVDQIRASVLRMVSLMESILAVGRLDHGVISIQPENCKLSELIELCCAGQKGISPSHRFHLDLERLPATILADQSALQQVFTNLLSNAAKYAANAPDIFITGWQENGLVHISVKDLGIGIDADDLPKMFQRYFRARTSTGIAGTGIGLNLVQQILDLHHGSIAVTSQKGCGSVFTVTLPIAAPTASNSPIPTIEAA